MKLVVKFECKSCNTKFKIKCDINKLTENIIFTFSKPCPKCGNINSIKLSQD